MRPQDRLPPPMRFFEYESRKIVAKAGIPTSPHGFATSAEEARRIAQEIGAPTVIKSQVLTGGRMKAGGVKFADTPDEAASHAEEILKLEINGHVPRGVLVDSRVAVKQEYYAGVTWDGTRKRPVMIFSPMGGIDIEEVAETHPDKVGRRHLSNLPRAADYEAKEVIASTGVTGKALQRADADHGPAGAAVLRVRHDAGGDQPARASSRTARSWPSTPTWTWRTRPGRARRRC